MTDDIGPYPGTPLQVVAPYSTDGATPQLPPGCGAVHIKLRRFAPHRRYRPQLVVAIGGVPAVIGFGGALVVLPAAEYIIEVQEAEARTRSALVTVSPGQTADFRYSTADRLGAPSTRNGKRKPATFTRAWLGFANISVAVAAATTAALAVAMSMLEKAGRPHLTVGQGFLLIIPIFAGCLVGLPRLVAWHHRRNWSRR